MMKNRPVQPIRIARYELLVVLTATLLSIGAASRASAQILGLERVTTGLAAPTFVAQAPGEPDRLFVAEQGGTIRIVDLATGAINATPFLTITDTDPAGEGGLLGLAFHPDYSNNRRFFVYVTVDNGGQMIDNEVSPFSSHVREYQASMGDPDVANATPVEILSWLQPRTNHNAGWIGFNPMIGPNDPQYLYILSGDGGKQGDPDNNAQTLTGDFLGKVLRLDIDGDDFPGDADRNYAIPTDNPFVGVTGDDEIWAYGLRNPWRASFDRATGDLWIADVGGSLREEVNTESGSSVGGVNYGWSVREGLTGPSFPGATDPVYDYTHGNGTFQGNAVAGGFVYRGPDPTLQGLYFFADQQSDNVWTFDPADPSGTVERINDQLGADVGSLASPVTFAEDADGNLYVADLFGGEVFAILTPEPGALALALSAGGALALLAQRRKSAFG